MDKKLISNYIYNILYQLVKIVMPLVIVPYTMGTLGATTLGISDFAGNIASWFILFGVLGVNLYGNREIAKVRDDKIELSKTFFEILMMQVINMGIACVLFALYVFVAVKENQTIYYLYLFTMLASMFDITWFFYGVENFKSASLRNIIVKIIGVACIMLFVKGPEDLWLYVVINSFSEIFGQAIMFVQLKNYISFEKINVIEGYKKHIKQTIVLFIPTIAISVYTLLDQTMLGFLTDDTSNVALYKASQGFVKMFLYFITSIGSVMLPRITNVFYNKGGKEEATRYINITIKIAMLLAIPMMFAMISVPPSFIPWYLPKQPEIITLIQVSSPIVVFISLSNVFGIQYLVPTGRNKEYTQSVVFGACTNFAVNLILIPRLGGIGATIGSVVAELVVTLTQYIYVRKELNINWDASFVKYIISAVVMYFVVTFIGNKLDASILTNVIQALVGASLYGIILLLSKEEMVLKVVKKVLKRG